MDTKLRTFIKSVSETFSIDTQLLCKLAVQSGLELKAELPAELTREYLVGLNVAALKSICKDRKLKLVGKKDDIIERILETRVESKQELSALTNGQLKELCRESKLSVTGKKEELIARLTGKEFHAEVFSKKEKSTLVKKRVAIIKPDSNGIYSHEESELVFDPNTLKVIGSKINDGIRMKESDIDICKDYNFDMELPENLDEIRAGIEYENEEYYTDYETEEEN